MVARAGNLIQLASKVNSTVNITFTAGATDLNDKENIKYFCFEKRVNDAVCLAIRDCRGKTGRKKTELLKKIRKITVREEDIRSNELDDTHTVTVLDETEVKATH